MEQVRALEDVCGSVRPSVHCEGITILHLRQSDGEEIGPRLADAGLSVVFTSELKQHPSVFFSDNRKFRHSVEQETPLERQADSPFINSAAFDRSDIEAEAQYSPL